MAVPYGTASNRISSYSPLVADHVWRKRKREGALEGPERVQVVRSRKKKKKGMFQPLTDWWDEQRDRHLVLLGMLFTLGTMMLVWAIVFFAFLSSNIQQETNEWAQWSTLTWVGAFLGLVSTIFIAPEFFHYLAHYNTLQEILATDSRAELAQREAEARDAVKLLGGQWLARLESKKVELGMRKSMPAGLELIESEGGQWLGSWWSTESSRLSERFPNVEMFKDSGINRILSGTSIVGLIFFLWNAVHGVARETETTARNMTVDLTGIVTGAEYNATWAPHFDLIGGMLMVFFGTILYMTSPTPDDSPSDEEE